MKLFRKSFFILTLSVLVLSGGGYNANAIPLVGVPATYTLDADFEEGSLINVVHNPDDQLQLDDTITPFNFIWVSVSSKGTAVKIDTETGVVLGEYRTTPQSQILGDPSRTTVDNDGSVWVANRNDAYEGYGSVVHIGLKENGQCEDRNNNGIIETSTGLGDVLAWTDTTGTRRVATAQDECIVHYTKLNSRGARHVSVDANNDVWVGGLWTRSFDLIKGGKYDVPNSGNIIRSELSVGYGGYGGLIDGNGVIWSANPLLRWDTANPLIGPNGGNWTGYSHDSYGLCIDSMGNVWNTSLSGSVIRKFAPNGTLLGTYPHGNTYAQGCVAGNNDDIWVAHSILGPQNTVGHIKNDGTYIGKVTVGSGPTGVAVDAAGKIWATNYNSKTVSRIDPSAGPIGADGITPIGAVDFTSVNLGGYLYNYSYMTGSTLLGAPKNGTWSVTHNSGIVDAEWGLISWNVSEPGDSSVTVTAASSVDGITFGPEEAVSQNTDLTVANGQYLKINVSFKRSSSDADLNGIKDSPILYDLTLNISEIEVPVDIKPTSCRNPLNLKSKGVIPAAILGTSDFNVNDVDVSTVKLAGVSPIRFSIEDVATPFYPFVGKKDAFDCTTDGPDGFSDLTLKFDTQEIVDQLGAVNDGDVLVLKLTGRLLNGTKIAGEDVIVVLKKGK